MRGKQLPLLADYRHVQNRMREPRLLVAYVPAFSQASGKAAHLSAAQAISRPCLENPLGKEDGGTPYSTTTAALLHSSCHAMPAGHACPPLVHLRAPADHAAHAAPNHHQGGRHLQHLGGTICQDACSTGSATREMHGGIVKCCRRQGVEVAVLSIQASQPQRSALPTSNPAQDVLGSRQASCPVALLAGWQPAPALASRTKPAARNRGAACLLQRAGHAGPRNHG